MRRKDREITGMDQVLDIVEGAKILHLGLMDDDGYPYIVPLNYGYETAGGSLIFYMHSAKDGHKLDRIRQNPKVCIELECDTELVPGGDIPCRYGLTYASVIGWGMAEIVEDEQEKVRGLKLLMKNQTGRDFEMDGRMASAVEVLKVVVPHFTAKARRK